MKHAAPHEEAFEHCLNAARSADFDRWLCTLFAPETARPALWALLAFNDEISKTRAAVSEPMMGLIRLQWWRESIEQVFANDPRRHPVVEALAASVARHGLSRRYFDRMIDARERDLDGQPIDNMDALESYAEETSATLQWLVLEAVSEARDEASMAAARHVGIAWALTGILRAVPFHVANGLVLLPEDMMAHADLRASRLLSRSERSKLKGICSDIGERAQRHLAAAREIRGSVMAEALPALLPATLAGLYLKRIGRGGFDPVESRIEVSVPRRQFAVLKGAITKRY